MQIVSRAIIGPPTFQQIEYSPSIQTFKRGKNFFDQLGSQLGYKSMEDWYNVTGKDIRSKNGGRGLLQYYKSSPSLALQTIYPQHKWILERFKKKPKQLEKGGNHENTGK